MKVLSKTLEKRYQEFHKKFIKEFATGEYSSFEIVLFLELIKQNIILDKINTEMFIKRLRENLEYGN